MRRMANSSGVPTARSLCEAFHATAAVNPDGVALRTPGGAVEVTWAEYAERVRRIAAGLAALGGAAGDTVALMMVNRPEFHLLDTAAMHLGATPFSIYNTSSPEQINFLFSNAGNRVVITEPQFIDRLLAARDGTAVETIVCVEGSHPEAMTLEQLEAGGDPGFDFEASWRAVEPEDALTIIYTSGTTGPPKGVELTHANILAETAAVQQVLPLLPGDRTTSYLPSAHIADRVIGHYLSITHGLQLTSVGDPRAVAAALPDVRPTVWGRCPGSGRRSKPRSRRRWRPSRMSSAGRRSPGPSMSACARSEPSRPRSMAAARVRTRSCWHSTGRRTRWCCRRSAA